MVVPQIAIQNTHVLLTFSRLTGSLNAESMTSLVGTIFHFGMISSTWVRRVTTTGCGFTFSEICNVAYISSFRNQAARAYSWQFSIKVQTAPCTLAPQELHRPRRPDPSCAAGERRLHPSTRHIETGFCFCIPPYLQKEFILANIIQTKFSRLSKIEIPNWIIIHYLRIYRESHLYNTMKRSSPAFFLKDIERIKRYIINSQTSIYTCENFGLFWQKLWW